MISDTDNLFKETRIILAKVLKMDAEKILLPSSLQDDLGIDSVDFWDVVAAFGKKYKVRVSDEEAEALRTVSDLVEVLQTKINVK